MKIKTVSYEKCHNLGDYEHEKLRMEAELPEGEDPTQAIDALRAMVDGDIARADQRREDTHQRLNGTYAKVHIGDTVGDPVGKAFVVVAKDHDNARLESADGELRILTPLEMAPYYIKRNGVFGAVRVGTVLVSPENLEFRVAEKRESEIVVDAQGPGHADQPAGLVFGALDIQDWRFKHSRVDDIDYDPMAEE